MSNGISGLKELAYLYREIRRISGAYPYDITDQIDTPDWFIVEEEDDDDDDAPMTQMIYRADQLAREVLKDV